MEALDGKIGHAELEIGDSLVMLSDPFPQATSRPPKYLGGTTAGVFMYVESRTSRRRRSPSAVMRRCLLLSN